MAPSRTVNPSSPPPQPAASASRPRPTAVLWFYALAASALLIVALRSSLPLLGTTFPGFFVLDNGILAAVYGGDWTGPRAGLPFDGGVLVAVEGEPFAGGRALLEKAAGRPPGQIIHYRVEHRGTHHEFAVPTMQLGGRAFLQTFGSYLFLASTLLLIGGIALWLRPDRLTARSLAATLGAVGGIFALALDHMAGYRWIGAYHVFEGLAPAAILHLALVFPRERLRPSARFRLLVGVTALLAVATGVEFAIFYERPPLAWRWDAGGYLLMAALGIAMIASFAESLARGRDPGERTRAALVFTGGLVGFLLPAAALFAFFLLGVDVSTIWWTPFLAVFALFLLYAIVRHDLLEAERVVRVGVGYVLATAGMLIAYAVSLALLSRLVWPGAERSPIASFLLVLAVAVSFEPLRRRVQVGIDRVFYRSRVDVARVLEESSLDLVALETEAEIALYLEMLLAETLGCAWVRVELDSPGNPGSEAVLFEPVLFRSERLGAIACGVKRSGAPFSAAELDLVHGLAAQTALAVHNVRTLRDLRAAQQRLLHAERLAAVGEFAGAVAHGIRNPLAGIRAAAQVAHLRASSGELAVESLANVLAEADRLDHRIRSLLDFSRPYQLRLGRVDVGELLATVCRSLADRAAAQGVAIERAGATARIEADADYLDEALLELGLNALRAMPEGGTLGIECESAQDHVIVDVVDTGAGVPEGVRDRVFDLFFTTRPEGSGVGLPTVKKIVELHGGRIALVRSDPGGRRFRIVLPRAS
jgi:signal transduction histidine kinase